MAIGQWAGRVGPLRIIALTPASSAPAGVALLGAGCLFQLYVAGVNYAQNSPEGYSPVADAKVSTHQPFTTNVRERPTGVVWPM
jgi:hypothetical protein